MKINSILLSYYKLLGFTTLILTAYGIYINYSPVPHSDMWDSYLHFFAIFDSGVWSALFQQHNEHRIVLSKILFLIDIYFFKGTLVFLLFINFFLAGCIALSLGVYGKNILKNNQLLQKLFFYIAIVMAFSWIQKENLDWAFQSLFFLAYLLPFLSFYVFIISHQKKSLKLFLLGALLGTLSVGTMANGILVLPILFVLGIVLKESLPKLFLLLLLCCITIYLYYFIVGYNPVAGHGSLKETLLNHPIDFIQYLLGYLGGVFYWVIGKSNIIIPQIAGVFLLFSSLFFTYLALFKRRENLFIFVALAFLLYYGGTAFGTTGGRAIFGIESAFSSRYMTPNLMAWFLITLLWVQYSLEMKKEKLFKALIILITISLSTLSVREFRVFRVDENKNFEKLLGSLALELQVRDSAYIKKVYPFVDSILGRVPLYQQENISIFSHKDIQDVRELLGTKIQKLPTEKMIGYLDETVTVEGGFLRAKGWVFDKTSENRPDNLLVVREDKIIVGYLLVGFARKDLLSVDKRAEKNGFFGYIDGPKATNKLFIIDRVNNKYLPVDFKTSYYKVTTMNTVKSNFTNSFTEVVDNSFVANGTYDKELLKDFNIYGSYNTSDKDTGKITIQVQSTSKMLIKTGPRNSALKLKIFTNERVLQEELVPISSQWTTLSFYKDRVPKEFFIEIEDSGKDWGEWCAVGLKKKRVSWN